MAPHGCPYCLSRPPPIWSHTSLFCSTPTPATITLRIKFKVLPRPHGLLDPAWSTSPPHLSSPAAHSSPATLAFLVLISRSALLPSHAGLPDSHLPQRTPPQPRWPSCFSNTPSTLQLGAFAPVSPSPPGMLFPFPFTANFCFSTRPRPKMSPSESVNPDLPAKKNFFSYRYAVGLLQGQEPSWPCLLVSLKSLRLQIPLTVAE